MKVLKLFISIFVVIVIIYWTKLSGIKFRSTDEFQIAKDFILNDKNIMNLFGDMSSVQYVKGETFTDKNRKWSIYQFKAEDSLSQRITIWVSPDSSCKGFLVKTEFYVTHDDIRKTEEECVSKDN